jgi:hypothetical protein
MDAKTFIEGIQSDMVQVLGKKFKDCTPCAMIAGPAVVIEVIVKQASYASGIEMDWGYVGGRGLVYALGERKAARSALFSAMPQSDLTQLDF